MPHPPRLVVGGDFEGGSTPTACPLGGDLPYMGDLYCTFAHTYSTDLTKETAPVEGNLLIALFKSPITPHAPSTNLGGWGTTVIAV